jgi:alpha-1,3-rhamnosyltransferase
MPERPVVDVLISSYNHAPFVEEAILSVLRQTYPRVCLSVVDDGSSDASVPLIRALSERYGFSFETQGNRGLCPTLNHMIARTEGSYIVPFGSDDVMLPDRLEIQVAHMQGHPEAGVCGGDIELIDAEDRPLPRKGPRRARRLDFDDILLGRQPGVPAPTLMIRRGALDAAGGIDSSIGLEDLQIVLKIARAGYAVDVLDTVLARYRVHRENTYKNYRHMIASVLRTYALFEDYPLIEKAKAMFLSRMVVKLADKDKALAWETLRRIPLRSWNRKTWKGVARLLLSG